jgi:SAM-dependent methyltransferase
MRRIIVLGALAAVAAAAWARRTQGARAMEELESRLTDWGHRSEHALVAGMLDLRPEDDLLDVACGSGTFLAERAGQVRFVAGLDASDVQVEHARRNLAERIADGSAEIVKGDAGCLPWADGRFSVVTCMGSFGFFPEPQRALAEMRRVLSPGGRAVLNIGWQVPDGTKPHRSRVEGHWVWDEPLVRRMVEEAGFADIEISYAWPTGDDRLANLSWHVVGKQRFVRCARPGHPATTHRGGRGGVSELELAHDGRHRAPAALGVSPVVRGAGRMTVGSPYPKAR